MMNHNLYHVDLRPDPAQLEQLKNWMTVENNKKTGLLHDLSIVTDYARRNTLATVSLANEAIGFVTWDVFKRGGHIVVAAVAVKHRRSGVGRYLIEALFSHLLQQGVLALYLECAPAVSEKFWKKMGFQKMPKLPHHANADMPRLYKTLIPVQEQSAANLPCIQIFEYGSTKKQCWPLHYIAETNELALPIITPVAGDWYIEFIQSRTPERAEKIKNFKSGNYFDDPFLIITSA